MHLLNIKDGFQMFLFTSHQCHHALSGEANQLREGQAAMLGKKINL